MRNMERVLVIGCPGSGKSTFARALRDYTGLPLYYLDVIYHKPDRTTATRTEFDQTLEQILQQDRWIIDGNYQSTILRRLEFCDTVFWLDYPMKLCLESAISRIGQPREDMPWVEQGKDYEFLDSIRRFRTEKRPEILRLLCAAEDKQLYVFHTRAESATFLDNLANAHRKFTT